MSSTPAEEPKEEEDECKLEFNIFGEFLDDIEHENVGILNPNKPATKKDIDSLLKLIGGFQHWPLLNEDCKIEVVKYLDYPSRCKLERCSRADYEAVKKTPVEVYSVELFDNEKDPYTLCVEEFDTVTVRVQFHHDFNSGKLFEFIFSQLGDDTEVRWLQYVSKIRPKSRNLILKSCNYYEEAVKFGEKWMKKGNYEMKRVTIEMINYPVEISQIKFLPRCKSIRIAADHVETFRWWFQKVPDQLVDLQLSTNFDNRDTWTIPTEFLNAPQIMLTPEFYFWCRAAFTDEQFLNLKASKFSFDCVNVTEDGINQYIKKWVSGKGVENFKQAVLWSIRDWDQSAITRGLELRPWDTDFKTEAAGFCDDFERVCGRGTCYQISSAINPYESLTLSLSAVRVSIYGTGKKMEYDGRIYTYYSIP
ncbi:hypothetical protein GCK72_009349 [Caenorhabditis remanei]|uniref:F-box associated domain-containing protein n=1 Tax=Caenorhabditis remanei TaxID=31234 RepID=A0A6A5H2B7_CAERE|nr:hypothetical protein GCK72_009349 [Caenorhabditis remanei]KAF1761095.1 hypothetical protein GCK72_009349 [Caenorhabditis remanei]